MRYLIKLSPWVAGVLVSVAGTARAHVPYVEWRDYTVARPLAISDVEQSIAAYAWLETGKSAEGDVDVYRFEVTGAEPVDFFAEVLVPVCPDYAAFEPWFALLGPDLPPPDVDLPVELPEDYGALVVGRGDPLPDRETFYEPFGGKEYYQGLGIEEPLTSPGTYYIVYWHPQGKGGDYVAVSGRKERFRFADILRALFWTPKIRKDEELHVVCGASP